jgi:hypothetical protein
VGERGCGIPGPPQTRGIQAAPAASRSLPDAKSIKPSEVVLVILDIVLMALVRATIESLLMWSICKQYRDAGCEHVRIRRRLQVKVRVVSLDEPEAHSMAVPDVRTSV